MTEKQMQLIYELAEAFKVDLRSVLEQVPAKDEIYCANQITDFSKALLKDIDSNNVDENNCYRCFNDSSFEYLCSRLNEAPFVQEQIDSLLSDFIHDCARAIEGNYVSRSYEDIFNNVYQKKQDISERPKDIKCNFRIENGNGACIGNAYRVAHDNNCFIVEGYVLTHFKDSRSMECVGHFWNEKDGIHFDVTIQDSEDNIEKLQYFVRDRYPTHEAKTYFKYQNPINKVVTFRTDVKRQERIVRMLLQEKYRSNTTI